MVLRGVHEPIAVHWLLEGPADHEGAVPIIGTDLAPTWLVSNFLGTRVSHTAGRLSHTAGRLFTVGATWEAP